MTCAASSNPLPTPASTSVPAPRLTAHHQRRLARLRPTDWLLLLLRQQGWQIGAIATALGVHPGRIAQCLHRARFALEVPRSTQALLAAVPWQQCPEEARAACARLLARRRQGPPPATPWDPSRSQTGHACEPAQPDGLSSAAPETAEASASFDAAGRRRLTDISYLLPRDQEELNRLDYQHYVLRQVFHGSLLAPVQDLLREGTAVLDVGTGTGRWAIEVAEAFPRCRVVGFDREPARSSQGLPPGYRFVQGDLLQGLPFADATFGYVHQHLLVAGIPLAQWPSVLRELLRVTRPGGWIELVELGLGFWPPGPCLQQIVTWWQQLSVARGMDASQLFLLGRWLREAGTVQVEQRTCWLPVGRWGGRLGQLLAQDLLTAARSLEAPVESLGVPVVRFQEVLAGLAREWEEGQVTYEVYAAWGRKP